MSGQYRFVVVSSITYAYKGRDALQNKGYNAYIERASKEISTCGCHFILKVKGCSAERAVQILKDAHVKIIKTIDENEYEGNHHPY